MDLPLIRAPFDRPLVLSAITDAELNDLLSRLGLFPGQAFVRENEEVLVYPVRVRSGGRDVVLGGGMAMRVIVHLDSGARLPLTDMVPGQTGHLEGITCTAHLAEALSVLGIGENETITCLRRLPHMDYTVLVGKGHRERISEGLAAKIWGCIGDRHLQFVSSGKGQPFDVEKILGGTRSFNILKEKGIYPGGRLTLQAVAPAQTIAMTSHEPVVITTDDGLHLHLRPGQAGHILVSLKKP